MTVSASGTETATGSTGPAAAREPESRAGRCTHRARARRLRGRSGVGCGMVRGAKVKYTQSHGGHRGLRRGLGAPRGTRPRARYLRLAPAPLGLPDHKLTATRSARGSASPTPAPPGVLVVTGIPETADVPRSAQKRLPPAGGPRSTARGRRSAGSPPRLPRSPPLRLRAHCVRGARCPRTPPCVARPPSEHGHLPPTVTGQLPRPHSSRLPLRPRV